MQVIEALFIRVEEPHDYLHIKHVRSSDQPCMEPVQAGRPPPQHPPYPRASALMTRSPENDTPVTRNPENDTESRFQHLQQASRTPVAILGVSRHW
jgi:hypothetical protein